MHGSRFSAWAHFAIRGRPFQAKIAIVQCGVPLLFSRHILIMLGMTYRIEGQKADLRSLGLRNVDMELSATGHPALVVSDLPEDLAYLSQEWTVATTDIGIRLPMVGDKLDRLKDMRCEAYMAAADPVVGIWGNNTEYLFYPKKIPIEIENMLISSSLSKVSFYSWWKGANQSRTPMSSPLLPSPWKMNGTDLVRELDTYEVATHPRWTCQS